MNIKFLIIGALVAIFSFQAFGKGGTNAVVFAAAAQGDVVKLKEFLAADPKLLPLRNELLRTAAMSGQKEAVEFLISQGADVNEKGFFEMAPLAHMAMYGTRSDEKCAEVAIVLIAHGAEVDPVDQYGATPLLHAVELKKIKLMRVLLEHGASPARTFGGTYLTPLHYAMRDWDIEMIKLLLEFKPPLDGVDPDRTTPLMRALNSRNIEVARLLLEHGAKITPPRTVPGSGKNQSLYWSIQNDNLKNTPLLWAVRRGGVEMLALLLGFKAPVDALDQDGKTPLHYAVSAGQKEMVRLLLDAKASVNVVGGDGATPLFLAETAENKEIAEMLRQAATAQGVSVAGVTGPSREAMRAIAKRICAGDVTAFDELTNVVEEMSHSDRRIEANRQLNADRLRAASEIIGEAAGKGNDNAFQTLKKCLDDKHLKYFSLDPLGAAAAGHPEALDILLHCHQKWGILENSVCFALAPAAKANQPSAVDYFVTLALDPETAKRQYYGVAWLVREVLKSAAAQGNQKAKDALEKFAADSAQPHN